MATRTEPDRTRTARRPGRAGSTAPVAGPTPHRPGARRRPSPAVVRRRRAVALVVVLAVLALVVWGAVALVAVVRDQLASGAGSAAAAEESAQGPVDPVACEPTAVAVSLSPEAGSAGAAVAFDLTARNTGEVACLLDAGSSLVLSVRSGSDRVWSSGDCAAGSGSRNLLLAPGDSTSTSITWGGGRSSAGCAAVDGSVDAGTYRVHAVLDGRVLPGSAETFTLR